MEVAARPKVALPGPGDLSSNISAEDAAAAAADKAARAADKGEATGTRHKPSSVCQCAILGDMCYAALVGG